MKKTCTFTIMHFTIAFLVAYAMTGDIMIGGAIALVEPLCNSVGYYFHEKIWNKSVIKKMSSATNEQTPILN